MATLRSLVSQQSINASNTSTPQSIALAQVFADILGEVALKWAGFRESVGKVTVNGPVLDFGEDGYYPNVRSHYARYSFEGGGLTNDVMIASINAASYDLNNSSCEVWIERTGKDLCQLIKSAAPDCQLMWIRASDTVPGGPLTDVGPAGVGIGNVGFGPLTWFTFFGYISKIFVSGAKAKDQWGKGQWEGKAAAFIDGPILLFLGISYLCDKGADQPDKYLPYLVSINKTTTETLNRVKDLQKEVKTIQDQLQQITVLISESACQEASIKLETHLDTVSRLWKLYALNGPLSVLNRARSRIEGLQAGDVSRSDPQHVKDISDWANDVRLNIPAALDGIHEALMVCGKRKEG